MASMLCASVRRTTTCALMEALLLLCEAGRDRGMRKGAERASAVCLWVMMSSAQMRMRSWTATYLGDGALSCQAGVLALCSTCISMLAIALYRSSERARAAAKLTPPGRGRQGRRREWPGCGRADIV
jgi:hypothetical protein